MKTINEHIIKVVPLRNGQTGITKDKKMVFYLAGLSCDYGISILISPEWYKSNVSKFAIPKIDRPFLVPTYYVLELDEHDHKWVHDLILSGQNLY